MAGANHTRECQQCGCDISHLFATAKWCAPCHRLVKAARKREKRLAEKMEVDRVCQVCGVDIRHMSRNAKRCASCAEAARKACKKTPDEMAKSRARYHARKERDPALLERQRLYMRDRRADPEIHAQMLANRRADRQRPEAKAKDRAYKQTDKYKRWQRAYDKQKRAQPAYKKKVNDRQRHRYATDPEYRAKVNARNRLRKPWDETVTPESVANLLQAQKGKCAACSKSIRRGYHLDHILPLAKGGASTLANLQLLCQRCNTSKRHALYYEGAGGQMVMALGK